MQPRRSSRIPRAAPRRPPVAAAAANPTPTGWDHVADWYDRLLGDAGSDYHRNVIVPAALRLLDLRPGQRVLDLCCGQGVFVRAALDAGAADVLGIDASPRLIAAARQRGPQQRAMAGNEPARTRSGLKAGAQELPSANARDTKARSVNARSMDARSMNARDEKVGAGSTRFLVADATAGGAWADGSFDRAACVMAAHDLADLNGLCRTAAAALQPAGRFVMILVHPCFRVPRQSSWGWDETKNTQYRRIDRYAQPLEIPISTHPGRDDGATTTFYHRPLAEYLNALGDAGLAVVACEEPLSHRRAAPGGRSRGENRAAAEFPLFLGLAAIRLHGNAKPPAAGHQIIT